jgi:hypothetical protein
VSAPERTITSSPGHELLGAPPPMGPDQNPAKSSLNQETRGSKRPARSPRQRLCLLKGCGNRFRPTRALARYCSANCAEQGRQWSRWKAQQRYRETKNGKQKRQAQSRRYRRRNPSQRNPREGPRVITREFFRVFLRSSGLLCPVYPDPPISATAVLLP